MRGDGLSFGTKCGKQAINTDRDTSCGYLLAGEAFDQIIIPPAACNGAELYRLALLVLNIKGKLSLINRASIITETAHDGGVDDNAVGAIALCREQIGDLLKLGHALGTNL